MKVNMSENHEDGNLGLRGGYRIFATRDKAGAIISREKVLSG
jgi:hypothetical protein